MKIHHESPLPGIIKNPVVTLGIFDGVHKGHHKILESLVAKAEESGGESVVVTLWPHPRMVLFPEETRLKLLSTPEEKSRLLAAAGIDHLIILPFTADFANLDPCEFITRYLVNRLGIAHLIVGFDHHFGKDRTGNYERIAACASHFGFTIEKIDAIKTSQGILSSTFIRSLLENGNLEEANDALGAPYTVSGTVTGGSRLGRTIGFPTANIQVEEQWKLIPAIGVYAVDVHNESGVYHGMLNIGNKPTVSVQGTLPGIEVHIFDFDRDIYDKRITLAFRKRLRDEKRFGSLEELKKQLIQDEQESRDFFRNEKK